MSDDKQVDTSRRGLLVATCAAGGVAGLAAAGAFVSTFEPSERAKAAGAPVEVDIADLKPGEMKTVEWRGKPVWVVNRTKEMLDSLTKNDPNLIDAASENAGQQPGYCQNPTRSIKPQYLIVVGICTHLGCSPTYRAEVAPADLGPDWVGGWFCPCHGSRFDLAARVFNGSPAPTNLVIPPHKYLSDTRVLIGDDQGAAA